MFLALQSLADVRPELVDQSTETTVGERDRGAAHGQSESAVSGWIVGIREAAGRERSEHIREIERATAFVGPADELLRERVADAPLDRSFSQTKVARIFLEQYRVEKVREEATGRLIGKGCAIALAVSGGSLSIAGELVFGLAHAGLQSRSGEVERIKRALLEQMKFLARRKRRRIMPTGHAEFWNHTEDALRFFFLEDLLLGLRVFMRALPVSTSALIILVRRLRVRSSEWGSWCEEQHKPIK